MLTLLAFLIYASIVITSWTIVHTQNHDDPWGFFLAPLITICILIGGTWLWRFSRPKQPFNISPAWLVGASLFIAWLLFTIVSFFRPIETTHLPLIPLHLWWSANGAFFLHLLPLVLLLGIGTLTFRSAGQFFSQNLIPRRTQNPQDNSLTFLTTLAYGMFAWVLYALLLGSIGFLNTPAVLAGVAVSLWLGRKEFSQWWNWFTTPLERNLWIKSPWLEVGVVLLFLISASLVDGLRPTPIGYDDMTYYMNRVHQMAERTTLIPGGNAFPFELLATVFQQAFPLYSLFSGMSFGVFSLFLSGYAVFALGKELVDAKAGLVATTIFLALPMAAALTFFEVKPDTLLFFVSSLAIASWIRWLRIKRPASLFETAFLFGFAVSIKYTAFFLIGAFLTTLLFDLWQQRTSPSRSWKIYLNASWFFILPLLPWCIYHLVTFSPSEAFTLGTLIRSSPTAPLLTGDTWENLGIEPQMCRHTGAFEDFSRYHSPHVGISTIFMTPWDITMNTRVGNFASEIGFLFLVLLPLWLLRSPRTITFFPYGLLALAACGYFGLWFSFGELVPWYGFPGYLFLVLLIAPLFTPSSLSRPWRTLLWIILFLGLITQLAIRLKFTLSTPWLSFAAGFSQENILESSSFSEFTPPIRIINTDDEAKIIVMGSGIRYFIKNNDQRVLDDLHLDYFSCMFHENNSRLTIERLQLLGIRFIYISAERLEQQTVSKETTLRNKIKNFVHFAEQQLILRSSTSIGRLYEVPSLHQ